MSEKFVGVVTLMLTLVAATCSMQATSAAAQDCPGVRVHRGART